MNIDFEDFYEIIEKLIAARDEVNSLLSKRTLASQGLSNIYETFSKVKEEDDRYEEMVGRLLQEIKYIENLLNSKT